MSNAINSTACEEEQQSSPPITSSTFYDGPDGKVDKLPSNGLVKPGGLYIKDDEGALVFQMFTPDHSNLPEGSIDLNNLRATVSSSLTSNAKAESYKTSPPVVASATFVSGPVITLCFPVTELKPLPEAECRFKVRTKEGKLFYLYDVHDVHNQRELTHLPQSPFVDAQPPQTGTIVNGQLYVQYDCKVYKAYVAYTPQISIVDPNCNFRNCTGNKDQEDS